MKKREVHGKIFDSNKDSNIRGMDMIRRKLTLLILSLCAMFLVGCEKVVDLTDEETQLIAEYAAELLLKYDINYVDRIDEGNQKAEEMSSESLESTMNGEITTEVITDNTATEEATMEQGAEIDLEDAKSEEDTIIGTQKDIAAIAGIEGAKITFREYSVVDKYPTTGEQSDFLFLDASEGYRLLVLHFDVENTTSDILPVSLIDKGLEYRIVCNGTKAANSMLTILMDDLGTLDTKVEPDTPQEAVLIFQISDEMQDDIETMDLYVTYNKNENVIKILQ